MKRLVALFVAVALGSSMALAQSPGPKSGAPAPRSGKQGEGRQHGGMMMRGKLKEIETRVFSKLNLSAQQKSAIKSLDEKTAKSIAALRPAPKAGQQPTRPTEAQMDKMRAITKGRQDGLMKILNTKQQAQYKSLMEAEMKNLRDERMKQRGPNSKGGSKPK
ncbi:MAG: hypothetical protein JNK63_07175 [Chthonomonas sp.]|nr:hypothetical protein [Chthonomonas sp.]